MILMMTTVVFVVLVFIVVLMSNFHYCIQATYRQYKSILNNLNKQTYLFRSLQRKQKTAKMNNGLFENERFWS